MTPMSDFFHAIAWLFEKVLFLPLDALRDLQDSSWFFANILNWVFLLIGAAGFIYCIIGLKDYQDEERRVADKHFGKYQVKD